MPIIRHFFAEGLEHSEVLPPIQPGVAEHMRDLSVSGLGRLIIAECAKDDSSATISRFNTITFAVEGASLYLPLEVAEAEFDIQLEPEEEITIPIKRPSLARGDMLFRLDPTARHRLMH